MADNVRGQLAEISGLIDRAEAAAAEGDPDEDPAVEGDAPEAPQAPPLRETGGERRSASTPRLRDELAAAVGDGGQSSLL
jgi:hypothetical protein